MTDPAALTPPRSAADRWTEALADGDRPRATRLLQIQAWQLLGTYLNGGLAHRGLGFPLVAGEAPLLRRRAADLRRCWQAYGEAFAAQSLPSGESNTAAVLAAHYSRIAAEQTHLTGGEPTRLTVDPTHAHPDRPLQRHVPRPGGEWRHLHSFWLHGSSGDGHWKRGWSDVDTLAIVATAALRDPRQLAKLRRGLIHRRSVLMHEQPLQLHGHFVLAETDLDCLPTPMFPAVLFAEARAVFAAGGLFIVVQFDDHALARDTLWIHGIRDLVGLADCPPINELQRVFLLHRIYLLPSLYAQALGHATPKRESFANLAELLPAWSTDFFERAGEVWRQWAPPPAWHGAVRGSARILAANPFVYQQALRMITDRLGFFRAAPSGGWDALAREAGTVAARLWRELPAGEVDRVER